MALLTDLLAQTKERWSRAFTYILDGVPNTDREAWDDITNSLIGRRLYSNQGTVDYDYEENAIDFSPSGDITDRNDCVIWNQQKLHAIKEDSLYKLHAHWEQTDSTAREVTLWYRIQKNGEPKVETWTSVVATLDATTNVFTYPGSGTFDQITPIVDIPLTGSGISATIQHRMTRTDSVNGAIAVTFVDAHVDFDQDGSRQEFVK